MDLPDIFEKRAKKLLIHRIRLEYSNETSFLLHKLITVYIYYFDSVPKTRVGIFGKSGGKFRMTMELFRTNFKLFWTFSKYMQMRSPQMKMKKPSENTKNGYLPFANILLCVGFSKYSKPWCVCHCMKWTITRISSILRTVLMICVQIPLSQTFVL